MWSLLKKITVYLAIGLIILATISFGASLLYKDQLINDVIQQLNKNLSAKVDVDEVDVDAFRKFPFISVRLKNARVVHPRNSFTNDTLFQFSHVYLQVNLIKVLKKQIELERIDLHDGAIYLELDKNGKPNYTIFKTTDSGGQNTDLTLKAIRLNNIAFDFYNASKLIQANGELNNLVVSAVLSERNNYSIKGDLKAFSYIREGIAYADKRNLELDLQAIQESNTYSIQHGTIRVNQTHQLLTGNIQKLDKGLQFDLQAETRNLSIKEISDFLPDSLKHRVRNNSLGGTLSADTQIKGVLTAHKSPEINVQFNLENISLTLNDQSLSIDNFNARGTYTNGKYHNPSSSVIEISEFSGLLNSNRANGRAIVMNFNKPWAKLQLKTKLDLKSLAELLPEELLEFNGIIDGELVIRGRLNREQSLKEQWKRLDIVGYSHLENVNVHIENHGFRYSNISGSVYFEDNLLFDSIHTVINGNELWLSGDVQKFWGNQRSDMFNLQAKAYADKFILDSILFQTATNENSRVAINFPDKFLLNLQLNVKEFQFGEFRANKVDGMLRYRPKMLTLNSLKFASADGHYSGGGVIVQKLDKSFTLGSQSNLQNVNIQKLFASLQNFGQDVLTDKNLQGELSGNLDISANLQPNLKIYTKTLKLTSDIEINNGRLMQFEPLNGLSRFVDIDDLQDVSFDSMQNSIFIENEEIIIPEMKISSSIMNLTASGKHSFSNDFDYRLRLSLTELISGKSKKTEFKQQLNSTENRGAIFLHIFGNIDDYKIKYDTRSALESLKINLGKGKTEQKQKQPETTYDFQFEWEENTIKKQKAKPVQNKIQDTQFLIEWEEEQPDTTKIN